MFVFGKRSRDNLCGVHPDLILIASRALLYTNVDFGIIEGLRSYARQLQLVARGRSWTENSKHLKQPDGFAHAIDVIAAGDIDLDGDVDTTDKSLIWSPMAYGAISDAFFAAATELGIPLRWGGDWDCDGDTGDEQHFDGPHFELRR